MSGLSGYDSEAVGFDSVSSNANPKATNSSQTTEFSELEVEAQTNISKDFGCMAQPGQNDDTLVNYPPPGLNEFLRKVVPTVMEQLNLNDRDFLNNSSDTDEEEEAATAKLIQEIYDHPGSGDHDSSILSVTWSSGGNSFAVSIGQMVHDTWCQNNGIIRVYTLKRSEGAFIASLEISEKNCVAVLKYHPTIAALLAYGTTSGEVVLCNLTSGSLDEGTQLTSPAGCHGARRISCLHWADPMLANLFLLMQIKNKKRRRGASDQVLITSGSDGTINSWQVNVNQKVFENIVSYTLNESRKSEAPDITCFDFVKTYPLRPADEKMPDDLFVVGSKTGKLYLCKLNDAEDPVIDEFEGHGTCVLDVAFNSQRPGMFVSISMDSELRVYDVNQGTPLKVICPDMAISCMSWLQWPCLLVGLVSCDDLLKVYNVASGRETQLAGFSGRGDITSVAVTQKGLRVVAGEKNGTLRIWELPSNRTKLSNDTWT